MAFTLFAPGAFLAATSRAAATLGPKNLFPLLGVGESYRYDSGLKVIFNKVANDSRCPIGATCVSAGNAEINLGVKVGNKPTQYIVLNTNKKPMSIVLPLDNVGIPKSYILRVTELTPGRTKGKILPQSYYQLRLSVSVDK